MNLDPHELGEDKLTARAQQGEVEAFEQLVRLYREKAFGIAKRIVRDPVTAEDVVQEALLQAYVHITQLTDVERFAPWLSRIVRNQALMQVRKTERSAPEMLITIMAGRERGQKDGAESGASSDVNWDDLDHILYHMTRSKPQLGSFVEPERELMRRELFVAVRSMMQGLSKRERDVFEAHFFGQLKPQEIAHLFDMTEGGVYKLLTRSRQKVKMERVRHYLRERIDESDSEHKAKVHLPLRVPKDGWPSRLNSFAACVHLSLLHRGASEWVLSDVIGLTGQAFRLNLEAGRIDVSGPLMYFWEPVFAQGVKPLGLRFQHVGDGGLPPTAYMLGEAVAHAREAIGEGIPVIAWDLGSPEFGLLVGYDDNSQQFTGVDGKGMHTLSYDQLGRGGAGGLFVMMLRPIAKKPPLEEALQGALRMIIAHAYGEPTFPGYIGGLAGYEAWQTAIVDGTANPLGNAYNLRVVADAREHAIRFLRRLTTRMGKERNALLFRAEGHYYEAANCLAQLTHLFPFPQGGHLKDRESAREAVRWLCQLKEHEEAGIEALARLLHQLEKE